MKYEQNIPFYIHKFRDYPWEKYESEHYIFHVEKNSLAERDIEAIKARQEVSYEKIMSTLKLAPPEQKISYYFYLSHQRTKGGINGRRLVWSIYLQ